MVQRSGNYTNELSVYLSLSLVCFYHLFATANGVGFFSVSIICCAGRGGRYKKILRNDLAFVSCVLCRTERGGDFVQITSLPIYPFFSRAGDGNFKNDLVICFVGQREGKLEIITSLRCQGETEGNSKYIMTSWFSEFDVSVV